MTHIRRTRAEALLLELGRPGKEIPDQQTATSGILKVSPAVMSLTHKEILTIMVMNKDRMIEEVVNCIFTMAELEWVSSEDIHLGKSYSSFVTANVMLPLMAAKKLLQRGKL